MNVYDLDALEEYHDSRFVMKNIGDGTHTTAKLLHLRPGQEVPVHPHANKEVILLPRKGQAIAIAEDGTEMPLDAGTFCAMGVSPVFGLVNRGDIPFQTIVLLVSVSDNA